jgi:hypothetical protein
MARNATRLASRDFPDIEIRALEMATELRLRLLAVAQSVAGRTLRPSRLVTLLGLDKSLASRLVRSLKAQSDYEFLHLVPSPAGLRIFLDAARKVLENTASVSPARDAIAAFQDFLADIPGGRSSLDALLADSTVEVRQRAEKTAAQAVHRAMSYLLGFHCEAITSAILLQPSADGSAVDGIDVSRRSGVRLLRPSVPAALMSLDTTYSSQPTAPRLESLDGRAAPSDPMAFLLPRFCDPETPPLELVQSGRHVIFTLSGGSVALHRPITVASAFLIRNGWKQYRDDDRLEDGRSYLLHYPCRLLVRDLFIRDDLYVGSEPVVRLDLPSPSGPARPRMRNQPENINTLDMSTSIEQLGQGLGKAAVAGVPEHARLLRHAFDAAGWEPGRFRGYRVRMRHPVPMITMGWWIPLLTPRRK